MVICFSIVSREHVIYFNHLTELLNKIDVDFYACLFTVNFPSVGQKKSYFVFYLPLCLAQ